LIKPLPTPDAMAALVGQAFEVLTAALQFCDGETGGYFCIADGESGLPIVLTPFGTQTPEQARSTLRNAQEKPRRLATHPEHRASWQSRRPEKEEWGGAVRGRAHLFAFSGFPEPVDEAAMALVAEAAGELSKDEAAAIAGTSGNEILDRLRDALKQAR
jgi:hypothetical protein